MLTAPLDPFHEDGLFAFQGDGFCCSQLNSIWCQQGEVCIVICFPWMVCSPQQCIRPTHLPPQLVGQDEVKPGEVQGPLCLVAVQLVGLSEIRQVLMIHVDLELLIRAFKEMPPLL